MEDLLFSICCYELADPKDDRVSSKARKGILLRIKFDKYSQEYMLMMKFIEMKANMKERIDWISLSRYKVRANLQRGYVSLNFI